ncbi:beta-lactamase/transpeptidase-like protein [Lactarius akahatsu]|uniref:Beta-lactamase/transpeptidase-like protein n=1 Tax=Lactarius akahatsu TaxID=416441 RepID=A0AAD4QI85_9AGAM|nr:beta-lactamase/transpeptidase-like protein [Lactarius akahatsu]
MKFHHLIAIATVASIAQATANQHTFDVLEPILTPDLTDIVQEIVDTHQIPGLALAIVRKNGHSEFGTWGKKSEDGSRVTEDTLFNIGSCSKAFVAASLGILIDEFAQGRNTTPLPTGLSTLSWQTKLADILSGDWELSDPWASKKANLIDILSHVSGMPRHDLAYKRNHSTLNVTRNLRNLRPSHELREKFSYNNQMYMVGAHVITALSGIQFTEFVKDRILRPLKMTESTYSINEAIQSGKASETWTPFGRRIPPWMEGRDIELMAGPGGLISNVKELASWVKLFLNNGVDVDTNATIIPRGAFETMTSAHQIFFGYPTELSATIVGYGLGWMRFSVAGHDSLYHGGSAPGVSADITIPILDDVGIVALASAYAKHSALREVTVTVLRKLALPLAGCADESMPANLSAHAWTQFQSAASSSRRAREEDPTTAHEIPRLDLTGTYEDAGYGTFTLCDASSRSDECRSVLDDFRLVDESSMDNPNTLFGSWPSVWTSHARFNPTKTTGRYLVDFGSLYPTGYGRNTTPFVDWLDRTPADFVVEDGVVRGFGLSGGEREGYGSMEENFEVWFSKRSISGA